MGGRVKGRGAFEEEGVGGAQNGKEGGAVLGVEGRREGRGGHGAGATVDDEGGFDGGHCGLKLVVMVG